MEWSDAFASLRQRYWTNKARMAEEAGQNSVGLMSGGPRSVAAKVKQLAEMGVEAWAEPVGLGPDDAPTWNVMVRYDDLPLLFDTDPYATEPEVARAHQQDRNEYEQQRRAALPWVEIWYGDGAAGVFEAALRERFTVEQASRLRDWVLEDQAPTWRAIASWAHKEFAEEWRLSWTPTGHQGVGLDIATLAASMFGEDPFQAPWN